MNEQDVSSAVDDATLLVARIRDRVGASALAAECHEDIVRALDDLLVIHARLRDAVTSRDAAPQPPSMSSLPAATGTSALSGEAGAPVNMGDAIHSTAPQPLNAEIESLARQVDRVDLQLRKFNDLSSQRLRAVETEVRSRLDMIEMRHEALLNGRIFATLRRMSRVARLPARLFSGLASLTAAESTPIPKAEPLAPPAAGSVALVPATLPPAKSVRLAGVSYMTRRKGGVSAAGVTHAGTPLISVVMTCFDTADYVRAAAQSILSQTWANLELIAVDDCSTDGTRDVLEELAARDDRLKVYCFGENRGTYWCKNFGITKAAGALVTFMDSDDISLPERIEQQFNALNVVGRVVSTCNHVRKTPDGKTIAINGVTERVAYISQMVKREVFDEIGFFDTVRTSADDEFLRRIRITYGRDAEVNVRQPLYVALLREGSLTSDPENAINFVQGRNAGQTFLSAPRRHYAAMCDRWHGFLDGQGLRPYVPFPVVRRPFPVFGKLVVAGARYDGNHVTACIASYPPREEKLKAVIDSLLPQVDHVYVYLNEYVEIPSFLRHSRITVKLGGEGENIRDNGKFHFMGSVRDGYVFTVDDDIAYPPDYVQTLIRKIEFYERGAIIGVHGTIYAKPVRSFFKGRTLLHFEEALSRDTIVNQLGTGTVAFHSSLVKPSPDWFKDTGMADVWFAVETKRRNITHIAIERPALWLAPLGVEETTLFREFRKNDSVQTQAVRSVAPWKEILRPPLNAVLASRRSALGRAYARLLPRAGLENNG